jgi:predicted nucleic acid-binding protein
MHYLDTSVLMAYYWPEPRSAGVQQLLASLEGPTISPLVEVELCSVISRKVRAGDVAHAAATRLLAEFKSDVAEPRFRTVPIGTAEYDQARDWIVQLTSPLRVLDALHMAIAQANSLTLVTADKQLAAAAKHFGVACRLIA